MQIRIVVTLEEAAVDLDSGKVFYGEKVGLDVLGQPPEDPVVSAVVAKPR